MAKMVVNLEFVKNRADNAQYYKVASTTGCVEVEITPLSKIDVRPGSRLDPMDVKSMLAVSHQPDSNLTVNIK